MILSTSIESLDLVAIEKKLSEFKETHQRKGADNAHQLIKKNIYEEKSPRDGSESMIPYYKGYDQAVLDCMALIRDELIMKKTKSKN